MKRKPFPKGTALDNAMQETAFKVPATKPTTLLGWVAHRRAVWHNLEQSALCSKNNCLFRTDRSQAELVMLQAGRMVKELDFILNQIKDDHANIGREL